MNSYILVTVFCCIFVAAFGTPTSPVGATPDQAVQKCAEEKHLPLERAKQLSKHAVQPENENEKCFLACYLQQRGYMVDGKVDFDKMLEAHYNYVPPNVRPILEKVFNDCKKNMVYEGKSECQVATDAYSCAKRS